MPKNPLEKLTRKKEIRYPEEFKDPKEWVKWVNDTHTRMFLETKVFNGLDSVRVGHRKGITYLDDRNRTLGHEIMEAHDTGKGLPTLERRSAREIMYDPNGKTAGSRTTLNLFGQDGSHIRVQVTSADQDRLDSIEIVSPDGVVTTRYGGDQLETFLKFDGDKFGSVLEQDPLINPNANAASAPRRS
jgi:hypothetical protein